MTTSIKIIVKTSTRGSGPVFTNAGSTDEKVVIETKSDSDTAVLVSEVAQAAISVLERDLEGDEGEDETNGVSIQGSFIDEAAQMPLIIRVPQSFVDQFADYNDVHQFGGAGLLVLPITENVGPEIRENDEQQNFPGPGMFDVDFAEDLPDGSRPTVIDPVDGEILAEEKTDADPRNNTDEDF